jgi:hypothetical protein
MLEAVDLARDRRQPSIRLAWFRASKNGVARPTSAGMMLALVANPA